MKGGYKRCRTEWDSDFMDKIEDPFGYIEQLEDDMWDVAYQRDLYKIELDDLKSQRDKLEVQRNDWKTFGKLMFLGFLAICCIFIFYALNYN